MGSECCNSRHRILVEDLPLWTKPAIRGVSERVLKPEAATEEGFSDKVKRISGFVIDIYFLRGNPPPLRGLRHRLSTKGRDPQMEMHRS
jgi:hypothetical protein